MRPNHVAAWSDADALFQGPVEALGEFGKCGVAVAHLRSNIASILRPPLPAADMSKLHELFGGLVGVGLDLPDRMQAAPKK